MKNTQSLKPIRKSSVHQFASFLVIGTLATIVQISVYFVLSKVTMLYFATIVSLLLSTFCSTTLNRCFTFAEQAKNSQSSSLSLQMQGLVLMILTALAQTLAGSLAQDFGLSTQMESLLVAGAGAAIGGIRFLVMKFWMFNTDRQQISVSSEQVLSILVAVVRGDVRPLQLAKPILAGRH